MEYKITKTVQGERVAFKNPTEKFYKAVGGEEGMRRLMYHFYDIIYESEIANFFPQDPEEFEKVKIKNTKFFIQICGGPKVYEEAGGQDLNEYMIHVHDDFSISEKSRIAWLGCMKQALEDFDIEEDAKEEFWEYVEAFSKLTVNQFPKRRDPYF
ncbi:MAG: globin [Campylobacteraceae bacterium 4484_4]|nr:MAG: globin [Campylobacteraceae bacterium 4484_4]